MVKKWYPSSQRNFQKIIQSAISFKISLKKSVWIHQFDRPKMSLLCFYVTIVFLWCIWHQSVRKNVNKYLCRILSFYRCSYRRHSAKQVFLKILHYLQENTSVGVSLQEFRPAILIKRDNNTDVFLWILENF